MQTVIYNFYVAKNNYVKILETELIRSVGPSVGRSDSQSVGSKC